MSTPLPPRPAITPLTQPFWDGAKQGQLVIQRCRACGHYQHPPFPECGACRSTDLAFEPVSGCGTIFQRSIIELPVVSGFEQRIPYACLVVELDEQAELLVAGNLIDAGPYDAVIGRRVEVVFQQIDAELTLPVFRLAEEHS